MKKKHLIVSYILLSILLFLRFIILAVIGGFTRSGWTSITYEAGTYFFTALLIVWERKRLTEFNMDSIAVIFFIALKPIETLLPIGHSNKSLLLFYRPAGIFIWCISIALVIFLYRDNYRTEPVTRKKLLWLLMAFIIGLILAISSGFALSYQIEKSQMFSMNPGLIIVLNVVSIIYQAGYAGVSEEPLFRGFLWGYLLKLGWKNIWILLFQAGLFMLAHIYYLTSHPISFFLIVPIGGLVMGLTAWKSKSISTSIIVHGTGNGLGYQIGQLIRNLRLG